MNLIPDTVNGCETLRDVYELATNDGPKESKFTTPMLWDAVREVVPKFLHKAQEMAFRVHAKNTSLPRPVVCGPTAAYPEYQVHDYNNSWRPGGMFHDFIKSSGLECYSLHMYDQ